MYFCDFTNNLDGWKGDGVVSMQGGAGGHFRCSSPFTDDHNQEDAVGGPMLLFAWKHLEYQRVDGSFQTADMTDRRLTAHIKMVNWSLQTGMRLLPWLQARIPGTGPNWKYSDWAMTGFDDAGLFDGSAHEISALYSNDPTKWTYAAGGSPEQYAYAPLDVSLANTHNILLVGVYPFNVAQPTGIFDMDWIRIEKEV